MACVWWRLAFNIQSAKHPDVQGVTCLTSCWMRAIWIDIIVYRSSRVSGARCAWTWWPHCAVFAAYVDSDRSWQYDSRWAEEILESWTPSIQRANHLRQWTARWRGCWAWPRVVGQLGNWTSRWLSWCGQNYRQESITCDECRLQQLQGNSAVWWQLAECLSTVHSSMNFELMKLKACSYRCFWTRVFDCDLNWHKWCRMQNTEHDA